MMKFKRRRLENVKFEQEKNEGSSNLTRREGKKNISFQVTDRCSKLAESYSIVEILCVSEALGNDSPPSSLTQGL